MTAQRTTLLHAASLVVARLLVTLAVWRLGFEALSDDDFARVTLAQRFAVEPRLDPTGTSWLPFPFWVQGAVLAVAGRGLDVARGATMLLGSVSSLLLYGCARASGVSARGAWLGVLLWTFVPAGVFAGAATVPELATATLCASALLMTRRAEPWTALLAGALLLPATLSRYEAWPVAAFVILSIGIPSKATREQGKRDRSSAARAAAIALAALGPVAWILWNWHAHGDPWHFHARVSSYWFAWGGEAHESLGSLLTYPKTVTFEAPVLIVSLLGAAYWSRRRAELLRSWRRPVLGAACLVLALMLAQSTGGAPTHHPERTLLPVWALLWIAAADAFAGATARQGPGWSVVRCLWGLCALASLMTRTLTMAPSYGVHRTQEVRLGAWLRDHADGPVLLSPRDYGYFAIMAATGAPERVHLASSVDPRDEAAPSPFEHEPSLRARVKQAGARWLVAQGEHARVARRLGEERTVQGPWSVVQVTR